MEGLPWSPQQADQVWRPRRAGMRWILPQMGREGQLGPLLWTAATAPGRGPCQGLVEEAAFKGEGEEKQYTGSRNMPGMATLCPTHQLPRSPCHSSTHPAARLQGKATRSCTK
ncbi:glutaminyl-peptide cyclotransferase [Platysternon megacephalum]|uniref:Glutaminyl-peptide cyclotransferase n=1 Tax=Platysternon megacephalum TaxID=55544 RepID=A0A4D9DIX9_9SAUR|nr:glutaminyl-peptide cyclotransferase [Platysternon megacephalum]